MKGEYIDSRFSSSSIMKAEKRTPWRPYMGSDSAEPRESGHATAPQQPSDEPDRRHRPAGLGLGLARVLRRVRPRLAQTAARISHTGGDDLLAGFRRRPGCGDLPGPAAFVDRGRHG